MTESERPPVLPEFGGPKPHPMPALGDPAEPFATIRPLTASKAYNEAHTVVVPQSPALGDPADAPVGHVRESLRSDARMPTEHTIPAQPVRQSDSSSAAVDAAADGDFQPKGLRGFNTLDELVAFAEQGGSLNAAEAKELARQCRRLHADRVEFAMRAEEARAKALALESKKIGEGVERSMRLSLATERLIARAYNCAPKDVMDASREEIQQAAFGPLSWDPPDSPNDALHYAIRTHPLVHAIYQLGVQAGLKRSIDLRERPVVSGSFAHPSSVELREAADSMTYDVEREQLTYGADKPYPPNDVEG